MNDPPPIRLRPRKSKHAPNENPRKYVGGLRSVLRLVQMSKRGEEIHSATREGGRAENPQRSTSESRFGSATLRIRIQASGRHTEDTWPVRAQRAEDAWPRQGLMRGART